MTTRNIEQLESVVSTSHNIRSPEVKKHLLQIIAKWQRGDFSEADEDHNYVCNPQNGTLRKSRGPLSKDEELQFIEEWFMEGKRERGREK